MWPECYRPSTIIVNTILLESNCYPLVGLSSSKFSNFWPVGELLGSALVNIESLKAIFTIHICCSSICHKIDALFTKIKLNSLFENPHYLPKFIKQLHVSICKQSTLLVGWVKSLGIHQRVKVNSWREVIGHRLHNLQQQQQLSFKLLVV